MERPGCGRVGEEKEKKKKTENWRTTEKEARVAQRFLPLAASASASIRMPRKALEKTEQEEK